VIGETTGALQRMNFGWHEVRPEAKLEVIKISNEHAVVRGSYSEWPWHERTIELARRSATLTDRFDRADERSAHWRFHLDPRWLPVHRSEPQFLFEDSEGNRLEVQLEGEFESMQLEDYDYSPSYRVKERAFALELVASVSAEFYTIRFQLIRRNAATTE
jgi:hypothetical protein